MLTLETAAPRAAQRRPTHVDVDGGHALFVRDWGSGPPVLFLAGWGMESAAWGETMMALDRQGFRTIAYDRRGHGRSTDGGDIDYDLLADDLHEVIWALDLRAVTLVAHSGAAGEAIRYLGRYGDDRISNLVLVAPAGPCMTLKPDNPMGLPMEAIEANLHQLATDLQGWIEANADTFAPGATRRTLDWVALTAMSASRATLVSFQREILTVDLRGDLGALRIPVRIVHGSADVSTPLEITGQRFAELIPGAELLVYPEAGHGLMLTHAQRLADDIAANAARGAGLATEG